MIDTRFLFFQSLNSVVYRTTLQKACFEDVPEEEWKNLYKLSKQQGLTAVIFEKVSDFIDHNLIVSRPRKEVTLKWYSNTLSIEKRQELIRHLSQEFANKLAENGISTCVLKGIAVSKYYPNPLHREFGDLDCYLYEWTKSGIKWDNVYEKGNVAAEKASADVHRGHYKHSHITFKKLTIENHQFCLPVRGSKKTKELERHLRMILEKEPPSIKDQKQSNLLCPPADFNALFLTAHAMNHFLYESIKMRHLLDWALFLKAEYQNVDWNGFWKWCDKMHYTRFVECMNWICEKKIGLDEKVIGVVKLGRRTTFDVEKWGNRVLEDIFNGDTVYNKGNSTIMVRLNLVKNFFQSAWKYRHIAQKNFILDLVRQGSAMIWDKNPKL